MSDVPKQGLYILLWYLKQGMEKYLVKYVTKQF